MFKFLGVRMTLENKILGYFRNSTLKEIKDFFTIELMIRTCVDLFLC